MTTITISSHQDASLIIDQLKRESLEKDKRYDEREEAITSLINDFQSRIDQLTTERDKLKLYEERVETLIIEKIESQANHSAEIEKYKHLVQNATISSPIENTTPTIQSPIVTHHEDITPYKSIIIQMHDSLMSIVTPKEESLDETIPFLFGSLPRTDEEGSIPIVTLDELQSKTQMMLTTVSDHINSIRSENDILTEGTRSILLRVENLLNK